jgi:hypothetical protein
MSELPAEVGALAVHGQHDCPDFSEILAGTPTQMLLV